MSKPPDTNKNSNCFTEINEIWNDNDEADKIPNGDDELVFADELVAEADKLLPATESEANNLSLSQEFQQILPSDEFRWVINSHANVWKIMIVDDEREIHEVTQLALDGFIFQGKALTFLSAYSGAEAKALIETHPDTAVIFLDVVMEENDSGLQVVKYIRQIQKNNLVRIILRTGQPGEAPEQSVIVNYDINDYKLKVELTQQRLFVSMVASLRSYYDLLRIELNKIVLKQLNEQLHQRLIERQQAEQELKELNTKLIELNQAYERFVPSELLGLLNRNSIIDIQLGDQVEKEMTVLFADIRGFTTLSEGMTPQENFNFINSYLSKMAPIIKQYHGIIDKYIGDAIMALFPHNADEALQAAITMLKTLIYYNQGRKRAGYQPIKVGIGLNTGALMLGTLGYQNRMDGTVISDAVNLASRLEGMTKIYGSNLLISGNTYSRLNDTSQYVIRRLDTVMVRGKSKPITVYEVFDGEEASAIELKMQTLTEFEQGLTHYFQREFTEAIRCFKQVLQIDSQDKAAQIYLSRCKNYS
jgi:two-component system sensor histidine kinase ChiS